MSWYSLAVHTL